MPSIRYYNQTAPFWDWVASMESTAAEHPFFGPHVPPTADTRQANSQAPQNEKSAPPPEYDGSATPQAQEPAHPARPPHEGHPGCGKGRPNHRGGPHRGGWGARGRAGFPFGGFGPGAWGGFGHHDSPPHPGFDVNALVEFLSQRFGMNLSDFESKEKSSNTASEKDFTPSCDVFDTPEAYILHLSLPGAKKEDVGVNWDADKSEVSVAGVVYRAGDEEMLKTLAMNEREIGVFERKVRLGSRANPALVDSDAISAKMEDGVLIVKVPKVEEFVEVKRVDVE